MAWCNKIGTRLPIWNVQIESVGMGLMRRNQGSSAFGARLRTRIGSFLPALVAFAATPCDDIGQIIAAVIVGNLGACSDVPDGAYDDLVAYRVDLGIGPARMICVTSKVLSARSVDRPTAVDLEEIAVASGLKFIGLLGRKLATFVFDNESSLLNRRCRKKTRPVRERPIRKALLRAISGMYDDSRPCNHIGAVARLISQPSPPGARGRRI